GEDCAFAAIRQLPPAHVMEIGVGRERRSRYWRPWDVLTSRHSGGRGARTDGLAPGGLGDGAAGTGRALTRPEGAPAAALAGAAPAATLGALEAAIGSRVPDEVPFGVFLSGGVDSGLVATLASRALGRTFPTFSLRMAHRGYDESAFARGVAVAIGAEHHELT